MMVKVCGITRREDALAAAEAGASAIGFIFYKPSPRYVTPEKAAELGQGIDVWKVGVFVDEKPDFVSSVTAAARLDVAQIYGDAPTGLRVWQAIRVPEAGSFYWNSPWSSEPGRFEAIFLDSPANGVTFDWQFAKLIGEHEKVIIAGGLNESNVGEAIRIARPWGVDASSSLESAPGIKDHEKVRRFVQAAREQTS
jgi:phosphoribosylanthranilate isomerase